MFLLRNSLCNVPVEHLSNILWVRGTICAWHTPWSVLFGVTRMFTCSFTPQATSMSNASVLSAAASVGCVSRSRPEHTHYYTHTTGLCICKLNRKSCMELSWGWEGVVWECGAWDALQQDRWEHVGGDIWGKFPSTCEIITLFFFLSIPLREWVSH